MLQVVALRLRCNLRVEDSPSTKIREDSSAIGVKTQWKTEVKEVTTGVRGMLKSGMSLRCNDGADEIKLCSTSTEGTLLKEALATRQIVRSTERLSCESVRMNSQEEGAVRKMKAEGGNSQTDTQQPRRAGAAACPIPSDLREQRGVEEDCEEGDEGNSESFWKELQLYGEVAKMKLNIPGLGREREGKSGKGGAASLLGGTDLVGAMRIAAAAFVGEHDFRNFCKMDAANVHNYRRKIIHFHIMPVANQVAGFAGMPVWEIVVRGTAFLWHQVRCIVAVLFMVGRGWEKPEIVCDLLDLEMYPRKPQYVMASEAPLLLHHCAFSDVNFGCSKGAWEALSSHVNNMLGRIIIKAAILNEVASHISSIAPQVSSHEHGAKGQGKAPKRHIPLRLRATERSYLERQSR
ncbi:hypothetical protein CBR_g31748 [Chara braunii]|uniref:tRNA pseudouridine synthase n=1 Tax=Chara braunii TaxID=69332 RepID=A0A388JY33_CHABU|nr:hypothetical protein CBR_g31748 [Chara braunii]|eukprot:GBG62731.1 hypothetical protein CBR_g31748 [Chara braunii]